MQRDRFYYFFLVEFTLQHRQHIFTHSLCCGVHAYTHVIDNLLALYYVHLNRLLLYFNSLIILRT